MWHYNWGILLILGILLHLYNYWEHPPQVLINGTDMTSSVTNNQSLSVPPLSSTLLTIPLAQQQLPGNLFTVVLQYANPGTPESVAGGRVTKAHFPIESWPKSYECPFPTVNDGNYKVSVCLSVCLSVCPLANWCWLLQFHRDHGIDTLFFGEGSASKCGSGVPGSDIAGKLSLQYNFYCLIDNTIPLNKILNTSHVLAQHIADEADNKVTCISAQAFTVNWTPINYK